jgi:hypothetical protein
MGAERAARAPSGWGLPWFATLGLAGQVEKRRLYRDVNKEAAKKKLST